MVIICELNYVIVINDKLFLSAAANGLRGNIDPLRHLFVA